MLCPERLSQALFIESHFPLVQGSSEDKPGNKKKRSHGVRIAATAGPPPHHQSATGGIASQEDSTTSSNHDVLGKRASASRFVGTLYSMSAGE